MNRTEELLEEILSTLKRIDGKLLIPTYTYHYETTIQPPRPEDVPYETPQIWMGDSQYFCP
jgi:hypothetical protein